MQTKLFLLVGIVCAFSKELPAQAPNCTFKPPFFRMHFGTGGVEDVNTASLAVYDRVSTSCPTDGHYSFVSSTRNCFGGDWHTLSEDHTPGDGGGNMLLVNSAYNTGVFLSTRVKGFKANTTYQMGVWLMNVCRPSDKCPFPLLPDLLIRLQTPSGKTVAQFSTGELARQQAPHWTQHRARFTVPSGEPELILTFFNTAPGGCGNDFALDDISFQECVVPEITAVAKKAKQPLVAVKKATSKMPVVKKEPEKNRVRKLTNQAVPVITAASSRTDLPAATTVIPVSLPATAIPVPAVLKQRSNPLVSRIETAPGEIQIDLYDNGEIDGDTVSIYHNNRLVVAGQRLGQKPVSFRIQITKAQPSHEVVMVANNLGTIPPNTSLMIVTAGQKRHEVFISSTRQQNAKVLFELKKE